MGEVDYFDKLHWFTFSIREKEPIKRIKIIHFIMTQISYKQPKGNVLFSKTKKLTLKMFFLSKLCLH